DVICGLLSSPSVLLCNVKDWMDPSEARANATCPGVTYDQESHQVTLHLGGQEFIKSLTPLEGTQDTFTNFQQVYLWKDSDMGSRPESMGCRKDTVPRPASPTETGLTTELFSPVDLNQVIVNGNQSLPSQKHWLFKHLFSAQQANLWCLSRCVQEHSFCQLAEITESASLYFTCTLYPEAQVCDDIMESNAQGCRLILPQMPKALFRKKGGEVTCLTLSSLGIQMCSEENGGAWRILDCGSPDIEVHTYPFGWYQKPIAQNNAPSFCPSVVLPSLTEK
ncbi:TG isoform 16, partial [Pongo abelii]